MLMEKIVESTLINQGHCKTLGGEERQAVAFSVFYSDYLRLSSQGTSRVYLRLDRDTLVQREQERNSWLLPTQRALQAGRVSLIYICHNTTCPSI